ncbi:MAG: hypothetical protein J0M19_00100 [Sphingomonadales bacterium]|nr:hypothetical protein [Sphingomonadales bacterium]
MTVSADAPSTSAEAVGRKFLAMIASLKSPDDLSEEVVERAMGVPLEPGPGGPFASRPLVDDWVYVIVFVEQSPGRRKGAILEFINKSDRGADLSAVCELGFADYRDALIGMGFSEAPLTDELGRINHVSYHKGDLAIGITPELRVDTDGKAKPTCVRRIGL